MPAFGVGEEPPALGTTTIEQPTGGGREALAAPGTMEQFGQRVTAGFGEEGFTPTAKELGSALDVGKKAGLPTAAEVAKQQAQQTKMIGDRKKSELDLEYKELRNKLSRKKLSGEDDEIPITRSNIQTGLSTATTTLRGLEKSKQDLLKPDLLGNKMRKDDPAVVEVEGEIERWKVLQQAYMKALKAKTKEEAKAEIEGGAKVAAERAELAGGPLGRAKARHELEQSAFKGSPVGLDIALPGDEETAPAATTATPKPGVRAQRTAQDEEIIAALRQRGVPEHALEEELLRVKAMIRG
jgi:hypothetical protein